MIIKFVHVFSFMIGLFLLARWSTFVSLPINHDVRYDVDGEMIVTHAQRFIEIGNSRFVYEESRSLAREYIKESLVLQGVPEDQIIWNRFEWTERHAVGKNITTTTWTGINIIVWSNSTPIVDHPIRAVGAHYDTVHWGLNRTAGAHDNLAGTSLLMEVIVEFFKLQKHIQQEPEVPYMFVFFDQEEPGALGSKSYVDNARIAKNPKQFAYFVDVDAVGHRSAAGPILQTYPYEHKGRTRFSPRWLIDHAIVAGYRVRPDQGGLAVGNAHIGMSLLYQAHRYHLLSIPFLSDDGPFSWASVPTILVTDLDVFYGNNPDYHKITDQASILDAEMLQDTCKIVLELLISTLGDDSLPESSRIAEVVTAERSNKPFDIKQNPFIRFTMGILSTSFENIFSGNQQYLAVGPFTLGYFEILSLVIILLSYIYFHSFQVYRNIVLLSESVNNNNNNSSGTTSRSSKSDSMKRSSAFSNSDRDSSGSVDSDDNKLTSFKRNSSRADSAGSNDEKDDANFGNHNGINNSSSRYSSINIKANSNNNNSNSSNQSPTASPFRGYRVLFFHLLIMAFISLSDTVYTFQLIVLSFVSLATIHIHNGNINLITGFISGVFCANFIYKDIAQMQKLGRKGTGAQELSLGILLAIYISHSILIVIYGYDFNRKKQKLNNYDLNQPIKQQ